MEKSNEFCDDLRKPAAKVELGERRIWFWVGFQGEFLELNDDRIFWEEEKNGFNKKKKRRKRSEDEEGRNDIVAFGRLLKQKAMESLD